MRIALSSLALVALAACTSSSDDAPTSRIAVAVSPLSLPGLTDACYNIWVTNAPNGGGAVVWRKDMVCASGFGNGVGDVGYVGPCDADGPGGQRAGSVSLELVDMWTGGTHTSTPGAFATHADYQNPCGTSDFTPSYGTPSAAAWNDDGFPVCVKNVTCKANSDTQARFDLTVMRAANQGFFDIAVNFEDVFCSAKFDCKSGAPGNLTPLKLLFANDDQRHDTAVLGFACTAGGSAAPDTNLYLDDIVIKCDGQVVARLDPSVDDAGDPGAGNQLSSPGGYADVGDTNPIFQWQVSQGLEALGQTASPAFEKAYWNVAIGFDVSDLAGKSCRLTTRATASEKPLVNGTTAAGSVYPVIIWDLPLNEGKVGALTCGQFPLSGDPTAPVRTSYTTTPDCFDNHLATGTSSVTSTAITCPDVACVSDQACDDANACTSDTCDVLTHTCTNLQCTAPAIAWNNLSGLSDTGTTTATSAAPLTFNMAGWAQPMRFWRSGNAQQVRRYTPPSTVNGTFSSEHAGYAGYSFGWSGVFPYIDILSDGAAVSGVITFDFGVPATNRGTGWRYVFAMAGTAGSANEGPQTITVDKSLELLGRFDAFNTQRYPTFTSPSTILGHNGGGADGFLFFLLPSDTTIVNAALTGDTLAGGGSPDQFGFVVGMVHVGSCPSGCE